MEFRELLNMLLLSLSLATLLVTLVSFLIYKMRQFTARQRGQRFSLEGVFFRRYAPHVIEAAQANDKNKNKKKPPRRLYLDLGYLFVIVTLVLLGVFLMEGALYQRNQSAQRSVAAAEFRGLMEKGLLKQFNYVGPPQFSKLDEAIPLLWQQEQEIKKKRLQSMPIFLIKGEGLRSAQSFNQWSLFLNQHRVRWKEARVGQNVSGLVIYLQPGELHLKQRQWIEQQEGRSARFLLVGELLGQESSRKWLEERWGLGEHENAQRALDQKANYPTRFAAGKAPYWNLPPGLVLDWGSSLQDLRFESNAENYKFSTPAWVADFTGAGLASLSDNAARGFRFQFSEIDARRAWTALDPCPESAQKSQAENFYCDEVVLSSLLWLGARELPQLLTWPEGRRFAHVMSIDVEDRIQNVKSMLKSLDRLDMPSTLFVVSELLRDSPDLLRKSSHHVEIASQSDDHRALDDMSPREVFERIQRSRLDLEELTSKKVSGLRPPEERLSLEVLSGAHQNRLKYVFGNQDFFHLAPVFMSELDPLFVPRHIIDDVALSRIRGLVDSKDYVQVFNRDIQYTSRFGGAHVVSAHTQIFGEREWLSTYQSMLETLNHPQAWKTTLGSLVRWWRARSEVQIDWFVNGLSTRPKRIFEGMLKVSNPSSLELLSAVVVLPLGEKSVIDETHDWVWEPQDAVIQIVQEGSALKVKLRSLASQESLNVRILQKTK